jgi:DNA segregation ATPase FtsK/SpoIIIE-like protein
MSFTVRKEIQEEKAANKQQDRIINPALMECLDKRDRFKGLFWRSDSYISFFFNFKAGSWLKITKLKFFA